MVTGRKPECYTCLNPIALADLAGRQGTDLDHRHTAHRLQLEQYTNSSKTM